MILRDMFTKWVSEKLQIMCERFQSFIPPDSGDVPYLKLRYSFT